MSAFLSSPEKKWLSWDMQSISYIQERKSLKENSIPKNSSYLSYYMKTYVHKWAYYSVSYKRKR